MRLESNPTPLRHLVCLLFFISLVAILSGNSAAVDSVLSHDFKNFDPANPPQTWSITGGAEVTSVDEAGKGKVLRIEHKAGAAPGVSVKLDATRIKGGFHVSVDYKSNNPDAPAGGEPRGPLISLTMMDKEGNRRTVVPNGPIPNSAQWKKVNWNLTIPDDCSMLIVTLGTTENPADVYYEKLELTVDALAPIGQAPPVAVVPVAPQNPAAPPAANPAPQANQAPPAAVPTISSPATPPTGAAATAPLRSLDGDGYTFDPTIAQALHDLRKPGAKPNTYTVIGPGIPLKDALIGVPKAWKAVDASKEVTGAAAIPEALFMSLPRFIATNKPEIVFIVGPQTGTRKLFPDERFDWQDVAAICTRLGAVPVMVVPPPGLQDEQRKLMIEGARLGRCPVIDQKLTSMMSLKTRELIELLEKHVFERQAATTTAKPTEKPAEVE